MNDLVWVFTISLDNIGDVYTAGGVLLPHDQIRLHQLYAAYRSNPNVGSLRNSKLFHAQDDIIYEAELQQAIKNYDFTDFEEVRQVDTCKQKNNIIQTSLSPKCFGCDFFTDLTTYNVEPLRSSWKFEMDRSFCRAFYTRTNATKDYDFCAKH